jgi:hypothetical protein
MKQVRKKTENISLEHYLGCFGSFSIDDTICRKFCALSLRCAIETDQNAQLDLLDDLMVLNGTVLKFH